MKNNNVIVYTRVSTDEQAQQGYSLQHQEVTATAYCKLKEYNVLNVYTDDYSAKSFIRPEWKKLMTFIKSNKGLVNKLVFLKWDRFSRNSYEAMGMIKELEKLNVFVECIEQPLDLNIPENLLLLNIYLTVPEIENTKTSIRTKAGMRQASKNGCWVGTPPFGYDRDWVVYIPVKKNATIKPNSDSKIVVEIFELFTKDLLSAEGIRSHIKKKHDKNFSKQGILDILRNQVYIGNVKVKANKEECEEFYSGHHQRIISDELFRTAQNVLKNKKRKHIRKDNTSEFPLKEILKCSVCGLSYTASTTTKKKGTVKYPYYHCSKTKGHDRHAVQIVHTFFSDLLGEFSVKEEIKKLYKSVLMETINKQNNAVIGKQADIAKEIELVKKRIQNTENKIADDCTGGDDFIGMLKRYKAEENELVIQHATIKAEDTPKNSDVEYLIRLFDSLKIIYDNSDFILKRKIVSSIFPKPIYFLENHFRTEQVSPLLELLILNSNKLQRLKIETSHLKSGSSSTAPPAGLEPATL